jgi:hypothetical protein
MWSALFGYSSPANHVATPEVIVVNAKDTSCESDEQIVYLVDGTERVPWVLPKEHTKNVVSLRQWVFDTISRLPGEEHVEWYTFKVLPDNYIYWYMRRDANACTGYGVLMKYDPVDGRFIGIADRNATLPPVPQPTPTEPQTNTGTAVLSNNSNTLLAEEINVTTRPKRAPAKRSRK